MGKKFFYVAAFVASMAFTAVSCSDDKGDGGNGGNGGNGGDADYAANLDYNSSNAASWGNYMYNVATLLKQDATDLYNDWNVSYDGGNSYAVTFKNHNNSTYPSASSCIQEIIEGCSTISDEVGGAKLGDPYNLYQQGKTTEALYAVESWYSWHSRDDYTNNIWSIRNCYYGSLDGKVNSNSISAIMSTLDPTLDTEVKDAIQAAANAIQAIEQPLRNNINSSETVAAMEACTDLTEKLEALNTKTQQLFASGSYDTQLDAIINQYVDGVVLPTYKSLMEKNEALLTSVTNFKNSPSNENFAAACNAWLVAREPWEKSEGFLFGPVDAKGLDPNMDSWPLDQVAIVQILESRNYDDLNWVDSDTDEAIEASQAVRGFHTLEFLLFKDGQPRTIN